jgi:HD-like signal output (HDOD) protein
VSQLSYGLAKAVGEDADQAYMAGLFHDIGTFAVLSAARKLATRQERRITAQTLLKLIDAHAHVLDEKVISGWRLPDAVAKAVIHRRHPHEAVHDQRLAAVIALANDLGRPLGAWIPARAIDFAHHPSVEALKIDATRLPDEKSLLDLALKIEKVASIH